MLVASAMLLHSAVPEDAYLSFTSRSHLVSAGARLAWLEETRGIVNVVGCDVRTECTPQNLTNYTDGDGIAIGQLTFGDDGKTLLFTRAQEAGVDATSAVEPISHTTFAIRWPSSPAPKPAPIVIAPHVLASLHAGCAIPKPIEVAATLSSSLIL